MSIDQPLVIDRMVKRPGGRDVSLIITDHLEWGEQDDEHEELLLHKLGNYVAFVEDGRVLEEFADAVGATIWIEVIAKHALSDHAVGFYMSIRATLATKGIHFDVRLIDQSGHLSASKLPLS
jgi:hypothetical protein